MSATTKKKHVTKEVLEEYPLPEGSRQIVKVSAAKGNNLHEVLNANGDTFLVSMPTKFRKHVWIKRGDFIMVEPIDEGDKVKAEITHILFKDQIKYIQDRGLWPQGFSSGKPLQQNQTIPSDFLPPIDDDEDSSEENLSDLVHNLNRVQFNNLDSESEDSCSEEEEEDNYEKEVVEVDASEDVEHKVSCQNSKLTTNDDDYH